MIANVRGSDRGKGAVPDMEHDAGDIHSPGSYFRKQIVTEMQAGRGRGNRADVAGVTGLVPVEVLAGTAVRAAVSGEVALITRIPGYGQGIILDNGSGYFTIYANLDNIRVAVGDNVRTCQEIASEAPDPGRVYFEVRKGTETLDPEMWLKGTAR